MDRDYLPRAKWARILVCGAYALIGAGALWLAGKALPAAAPFIVAWLLAWALSRPIAFITRHTPLPRGVVAVVVCAVVIAAVTLTLFFAGGRLITGASDVVEYLDGTAAKIGERIGSISTLLRDKFPSLDRVGDGQMIEKSINQVVEAVIGRLSDFVAGAATAAVSGAPSAFLFIVVTVAASFYFTCGYPAITGFVKKHVPERMAERVAGWMRAVRKTVGAYAKCAVVTALISFAVLAVGFSIMGVNHPVLTASLCALVDVLPVFGVGTVLVPWAIVRIVGGEYAFGFGLATLYGICTLARQIVEPRLMAGSFGIHPAASLAAMYLGFRFFGLPGMLFLPVVASAAAGRMRS